MLRHLLGIHQHATMAALDALEKLRPPVSNDELFRDKRILAGIEAPSHVAIGHFIGPLVLPSAQPGETNGPAGRDPVRQFTRDLSRGDACPVCLELRRAWQEWFGWLERAVRDDDNIEDMPPTCPEHVWAVVKLGSPLMAVSAMRKTLNASFSLMQNSMAALVGNPSPKREPLLSRLRDKYYGPHERLALAREIVARPIGCAVCARLNVATERALDLPLGLLEERRYRIAFENGYGLCMKHFSRVLARAPAGPIPGVLARVQSAKLARLGWELEETLRKEAWNARPESKGTEQTAFKRAIARFSGC